LNEEGRERELLRQEMRRKRVEAAHGTTFTPYEFE
jgi:hypothetical protein